MNELTLHLPCGDTQLVRTMRPQDGGNEVYLATCPCGKYSGSVIASEFDEARRTSKGELWAARIKNLEKSFARLHDFKKES